MLLAACDIDVSAAASTNHPKGNAVVDIIGYQTHVDLNTRHVPDGNTEIRFRAGDVGEHGLVVFELKKGVTAESIVPLLAANDFTTLLRKVSPVGGTDVVEPGQTWRMVTDLDPATYVAADIGQVADESSNFSHGAITTFTVDKSNRSEGSVPRNTIKVKVGDNFYKMPAQLPRQSVLEVQNIGRQTHAITLVRLNRVSPPSKAWSQRCRATTSTSPVSRSAA